MPREVAEVRKLMRNLPIEDRLATLLISILDNNTDALDASLRLIYAIRRLSAKQSAGSRFQISEALRNLADVLECPLVSGATCSPVQRRGRADQ